MRLRVPPGRAGRLWLRHRLDVVRHGLAVLDRKLRVLRRERDRLADRAARTGEEWTAACRTADVWSARAAALGGRRAIRLAGGGPLAEVRVDWADAMGTSRPDRVVFVPPEPGDAASLPLTAALIPAREACLAALRAAVEHAAAAAAERIMAAEEAATRRRIRALRDHVLPAMEAALSVLELSLDEAERAEAVQARRAAARRAGDAAPRPGPPPDPPPDPVDGGG
ncbi:hypothetical protein JOL79_11935 [Microbispora sp. RL4-1S]|uniref:V-type ATPase, D subunit n=1 Tax=Microbispora oryzae TaxID=2806554 RepID=A0A940WF77_9ACTN|nr:V-type ATP synthase subunit D [Microbispora oryzae]MBP2704524.1 hypothetical protein [Microbispora oryzae]